MSGNDIHPLRDGDIDGVIALWQACDLTRSWNDPKADIERARAAPSSEIFVIEDDGEIVASVMAGDDGHRGWVYYLATSPDRRGEGLGRRIMDHAEAWLKARGAVKVNLMIRQGNPVEAFYDAIGYETEPRTTMAKWLDEPPEREKPAELEVTITYLEMTEMPTRVAAPLPRAAGKIALMRAEKPTVGFYRYLYDAVGGPWVWYERKLLTAEQLAEIVQDAAVEIYVLYCEGAPAGYVELDFRRGRDAELAYFGLIPDYIGRGLGRYMLDWAVDMAWSRGITRLGVNTCTLDHAGALPLYQKAGFVPCGQETITIKNPGKS